MANIEKKPLQKIKSVPPNEVEKMRPYLNQTRRHSWFGTARDLSMDYQPGSIAGMNNIKEEDNEEDSNVFYEKAKNSFSKSKQKKISAFKNSKSPDDPLKNTCKKALTEGNASAKYVGLKRNEKSISFQNSNPEESGKKSSAKRRSGLTSWLAGASSDRKKSNYVAEDSNAEPLKLSAEQKQSFVLGSETRAFSRRATIHYSSTGRPSLMNCKGQSLQHNTLRVPEIRALEQLKDVCRDFIAYRLRQRNLVNRVIFDRPKSKEDWLSRDMVYIYKELERIQTCRFTDISKQVGITLRSEEVLRKVFFELSNEILTTDLKPHHNSEKENSPDPPTRKLSSGKRLRSMGSRMTEITWGRLCAILAVAGGLAVDCVQQGHANLVNSLIDYVGDFAREENLISWIVNQGGWETFRELTYETSSGISNSDPCYFTKLTNIAMAFVFCTVSTVLAAITIGSFTRKT